KMTVVTSSDADAIDRPKRNEFGEETSLCRIFGGSTPAWRASSSTVRKSDGFESAVIGWRPRIAERTMAGETSHWARMKRNARPKTTAKAAGNARLWRT